MELFATQRGILGKRWIEPRKSAPQKLPADIELFGPYAGDDASMSVYITRHEPHTSAAQEVDQR